MGAAASAGAFTLVPRHVLGGPAHVPPSERLNIAGIGVGGRGQSNIQALSDEKQNIVAMCDVDWAHASGIFRRFPNAKRYKDFRQMLDDEDKNIDAVVISTADHAHAVASIMAMKRGKHVYCEKPLTHSVREARLVAQAARQAKVATQMGNGGQAGEERRIIAENIWAGAIGPVREVHIWTDRPNRGALGEYWPQGVERPKDTPSVPDSLDWDSWLGPAPVRPYHPAYTPFKWRGWWDFGTGALGDIGCHSFDPAVRALKLGAPISVEACSTRVNNETYPLGSVVTYHFPARGEMPALKFVWYDGGLKPPRPDGMDPGWQMGTNGSLYIGDKGIMAGHVIMPKARRDEFGKAAKVLPRSPGHYTEWINACKGGDPAGSNFDHAGPMTETVLLGNVALRMQLRERLFREALLWDCDNMQFTNVPEANQFLHREYRQGWSL